MGEVDTEAADAKAKVRWQGEVATDTVQAVRRRGEVATDAVRSDEERPLAVTVAVLLAVAVAGLLAVAVLPTAVASQRCGPGLADLALPAPRHARRPI